MATALTLLGAAPALAAVNRGKHESLQEYEQQLAAHQVSSATINRRLHRVHVVLKDGTLAYAEFAKHGEAPVEARLRAARVRFTVMTPQEAEQEASEGPKKKFARRYILAIVVGVLVIIGIAVYLVRRRRTALLE